jgi:Protein of unknown function (DUF4231)
MSSSAADSARSGCWRATFAAALEAGGREAGRRFGFGSAALLRVRSDVSPPGDNEGHRQEERAVLSQVLHVPYSVEQVEGGVWRARARPLPEAEAYGRGSTREEAIADLREALAGLIAEFGVPEEMILTLNVAWPPPQPGPPSWWQVWSRWRSWRRRRRTKRFSLDEWDPAIDGLNPGQGRYVRLRWARSIELMDIRHKKYVELFYVLRTLSILGGVAVTALSGIGISGKSSSAGIRWTIFALGFLVAGSAALEQIGHYNQRRMLTRGAREELLSAGFSYLLPAADPGHFDEFRDKIEGILRAYNQSYDKTLSG